VEDPIPALETSVEDILERSSDAFVALDAEWRYVYVNARAGELFGRRPNELVGRHIWTEFPEGVGQSFYHAYHRALERQELIELEDYYPPWDRWFENRIYPSPTGLSIFFHDITDRKRAEQALDERTDTLDLALTAARAGTWTWDLATSEVQWSDGVEEIFGLPPDSFDERLETYLELVHPDDRVRHATMIRDALEVGDQLELTHRIVRPCDGSIRWLEGIGRVLRDAEGRAVRVAGIVQDVTERAAAEQALRERERQLAEAQQVAHIGSFEWNVRDDRVSWSDELFRIYGSEPQAFGASFEAFLAQVHPEDRATVEETIGAALNGERPLRMQERIVRPDGEIRHLSSWGEVLFDDAGQPLRLLGICQDVTEQRRHREALQASEEQLGALVESLRDHALIQLAPDGRIGSWNRGAERLLGWDGADIVGRPIAALYPEEEQRAGQPKRDVAAAVRNGRFEEQGWRARKDGSRFWADVVLTVLSDGRGFSHLIHDGTEHREAELRRERLTERLNALHAVDLALLDGQPVATVAGIAVSRLVALLPDSHAQVVALDETSGEWELLAAEPAPFRSPAPPAQSQPAEAGRLATEGWHSLLEAPLIAGDQLSGMLTLVSTNADAFSDEHAAMARDVANQLAVAVQQCELRERIRQHADELERRVVERTQELEEANAELESFAYSVAHDLRAPLRAVQGLTQALMEDYAQDLDHVGRDYGQRTVAAVKRMDLLIADLLAYAKISRSEPRREPVSMTRVIDDVVAQLELEIAAREATLEIAEPLPDVIGHHLTLTQVLANLVSNGLKFTAAGKQPRLRIRAELAGDVVRLCVEDDGIGIEKAHLARIFRIFERLHGVETYPGTGIGLAIVRKGMQRMGGEAGVQSEPGRGSRFWVELPRAAEYDG
jgi:PAS domain S-box-containing protein